MHLSYSHARFSTGTVSSGTLHQTKGLFGPHIGSTTWWGLVLTTAAWCCGAAATKTDASQPETVQTQPRPSPADELGRRATWSPPPAETVRSLLEACMERQAVSEEIRAEVIQHWQTFKPDETGGLLDAWVSCVALFDEPTRTLVAACADTPTIASLPTAAWLGDASRAAELRHNGRLYFGRWLASHHYYHEAADQLTGLQPEDVMDPAALLFYQSVVHHQLRDKPQGQAALSRLLENEKLLPRRYRDVAKLVLRDWQAFKSDSLDEVARMMGSIRSQLDHGRAGKRVRTEEEAVVEKLDKMIKDLEKQLQQAQAAAAKAQGSLQPGSPMSDSFQAGGKGPGEVAPKTLGDHKAWGNLPPKEREEALQQLSKELPAHYRDVIEEYFRRLAKERTEEP